MKEQERSRKVSIIHQEELYPPQQVEEDQDRQDVIHKVPGITQGKRHPALNGTEKRISK